MTSFDSLAVLVVEDSTPVRALICKALRKNGFVNIVQVKDGNEALEAMALKLPDLIISDLNMPNLNGRQLLQAMLRHSQFRQIPFIVLTSETDDDTFKQVMKMGAADFIKKPFDEDQFMVKIRSVIEWL